MRDNIKPFLWPLAFAAPLYAASAINTETASNAAAETTILVGTEDNINDLVYAISWNGKDTIEYVTQTNVTHKTPSWLELHPTDNNKLLVIYRAISEYKTFEIGQDAKL